MTHTTSRRPFFDKAPEFIDLHLGQMQIPNEMAIDGSPLLPSQTHPLKHCINFAVFDPANRPQAIALDHHRYRIQQD
jgi:hypothetical protein